MANQKEKDQTNLKTGSQTPHFRGKSYEFHIKGHLTSDWADWLEGLEMRCLENGEMILSGVLPDQAALMGVLNKLNRLNLTILSASETDRNETEYSVDE